MGKKKSAIEIATTQQMQRAADACAEWCRKNRRSQIPDMALFVLNLAVQKFALRPNLDENVKFLDGVIKRHDKFEEQHDKMVGKMQAEDKKERAIARRSKAAKKPAKKKSSKK